MSFLLAIAASGTGLVGVIVARSLLSKRKFKALADIPSPPKHWLLGNLPQVLAAVKQKRLFQQLFQWSREYGPVYAYWAGSTPVLVLSQPNAIETTIVNGMRDGSLVRSPRARLAWNDISGPILLGESGSEWKWRRKAWNPNFTQGGLAQYREVVNGACARAKASIRQGLVSGEVRADEVFVELTMRVIACLLLGIPVDADSPSSEGPPLEVGRVYESMATIAYRFLRVTTGEQPWRKYLPTRSARDYWEARQYLETVLGPRVDLALQLRDGQHPDPESVREAFRSSLLCQIAAREPRYTRDLLMAEAIELFIAGTDTTAHSLSFAVGELACHPKVCRQARSLVDRVWERDGELTAEGLRELSYVGAIVKETLRLYSVGSGSTSLQATRETTIAGVKAPAGTKVFWSMLGAGRDPETYPEPERFEPERWLTEGTVAIPTIAFGSGLHRCLGEHLAMLESTTMLAQLLRHFEWELVNGRSSLENLQQNLLIFPVDGMPVRFKERSLAPVSMN